MTPELDRFGELLMEIVRDRAIQQADARVAGRLKSPSTPRLSERLQNLSSESRKAVYDLIPLIVDDVLFFALFHLDEHETQFFAKLQEGEHLQPVAYVHGELAGWLFNEDGWIARHSRERSTPAE